MDLTGLPRGEYGFPGPLRDALVAAILDGSKTTTSSLLADYGEDPLPQAGSREVLVDSDSRPVAVLETVGVTVRPLSGVTLAHAVAEGEGFATVDEWRAAHIAFWTGDEYSAEYGPHSAIAPDTPIVCEEFRVLTRLDSGVIGPATVS